MALCQMSAGDDVAENLRIAGGLLDEAAAGGADLAAVPETFPSLGSPAATPRSQSPFPRARG